MVIDDENVPLSPGTGDGLVIIDDEMVPLAAAPNTGDIVGQWLAMFGVSGTTLAGTVVTKMKKRR